MFTVRINWECRTCHTFNIKCASNYLQYRTKKVEMKEAKTTIKFLFSHQLSSLLTELNNYKFYKSHPQAEKGCVPLSQSKSRFCDQKFDFLFHWRPNESRIAIQTIYLRTWIVQIGISICFEKCVHWPLAVWSIFFQMLVPASEKIQSIQNNGKTNKKRQKNSFHWDVVLLRKDMNFFFARTVPISTFIQLSITLSFFSFCAFPSPISFIASLVFITCLLTMLWNIWFSPRVGSQERE